MDDTSCEDFSPNRLIREFLCERVLVFKELAALRDEGWANPSGDDYFKQQRKRADEAGLKEQRWFFHMMQQIGDEMENATGFLSQLVCEKDPPKVLDLCIAPGGFSAIIRQRLPTAEIGGISLPHSKGGHKLLFGHSDPRIRILFTDITMHSSEMGATSIPPNHPEAAAFIQSRPYLSEAFDLAICDGQVLRNHPRQSY
ncbi:uncharacterized protein K452DRAFT_363287, partial [Aplosporella prunicola CBS 121167]